MRLQTYTYDENGNLTSVKAAGNGKELYEYDTWNLENLISCETEGNGNYSYEYSTSGNTHQPVRVTNGTVSMGIEYSSYGEATKTTLSNTSDMQNLVSSAAYYDGLLTSQTDNTGAATVYGYTKDRECSSVTNAKEQKIQTYRDDIWGHTDRTYQSGIISLHFGYDSGDLASITRGGYYVTDATRGNKYNQIYGFEHDKFGNRTAVTLLGEVVDKSSGNVTSGSGVTTLVTYTYNDNNGTLNSMTYGPSTGTKVTYTYDKLDRVKTAKYSDTNTAYGYNYSADGSLAGITVNGTPVYDYTYDSLGRLIYSAKLQNNRPVLYTSHQYDTSDRLTKQSWQIGSDGFTETYTYDGTYGILTQMTSGGDTLDFLTTA